VKSPNGSAEQMLRVLFLNWRDTRHPEGGGSEVYVENVARSLAAAGHHVTIFCAMYEGAEPAETVDGVHFVRAGTKLSVYAEAVRRVRRKQFGDLDVIIDVQNGIPFMSRAVCGDTPVVVLVHHVHREQWPVVYDPLRSRIGWWIESRLAPRLYRDCTYVTVSQKSRDELISLGVSEHRMHVIHNGIESAPGLDVERSEYPHIAIVGRLVPHKRVEHVLRSAAILRSSYPDLRISVVGDGWWSPRLRAVADTLGVSDMVDFHGFVDEKTKHRIYASAWLLALPSLKEGWGIVVMEAATHGVPTVAYRSAGGVAESVVHGQTGVLVDGDVMDFAEAVRSLLESHQTRSMMGESARERAESFSWAATAKAFASVLSEVADTTSRVRVVPAPSGHVDHQASAPTPEKGQLSP
jgi:glycosyltransferase involved in cell wall biosynthesis